MVKKPSKKIIILIVVALLIISASVYNKFHIINTPTQTTEHSTQESYSNLDHNGNVDKNISTLDTDGDRLPDWQEIIADTDPNNSDTDGDGTLDGSELDLGRDPSIAGPNDKTKNPNTSGQQDTATSTTISEEVSKNLFANAVYLSNNDGLTDTNINTLVDNLITGVQNNFTYTEYTLSNLPTIKSPTKDDLRFFASTLATLQLKLLDDLSTNTDTQSMATIYNKHTKNLYEIKTPEGISETEILFINNFSKVSSVFEVFSKQKDDPLKLPLAVKAYQEAASEQSPLLAKIGEYLNENDIINSLDEVTRNYWTLSMTQ